MKKLLLLTLFCACTALMAEENVGYRVVHPDGTVEFTDDPTQGGEEIKLRDVQGSSSSPISRSPATQTPPEKLSPVKTNAKEANVYTAVSITSPTAEETVWFTDNGVTVTVNVMPQLKPEDMIVIKLDGEIRARGKSTSLNLGEVYRGTHTVEASVIDASGATLISSSSVVFYLRQHSAK